MTAQGPEASEIRIWQYDADGKRVGKGSITSMSCNLASNGYVPATDYVLRVPRPLRQQVAFVK